MFMTLLLGQYVMLLPENLSLPPSLWFIMIPAARLQSEEWPESKRHIVYKLLRCHRQLALWHMHTDSKFMSAVTSFKCNILIIVLFHTAITHSIISVSALLIPNNIWTDLKLCQPWTSQSTVWRTGWWIVMWQSEIKNNERQMWNGMFSTYTWHKKQ